jgi:hypothetical protein
MAFATKAEKHGAKLKDVGLSHVAVYQFSTLDRTRVERIEHVYSVDVVIRPATTKSFSESHTVPEKTASEFLESLGIDLQTWNDTPIDFAFNERALFDRNYISDDRFDPEAALNILAGHSAEGSKALDGVTFI